MGREFGEAAWCKSIVGSIVKLDNLVPGEQFEDLTDETETKQESYVELSSREKTLV